MKTKTLKVWITVKNEEVLGVFESFDEVYGLYDYMEHIYVSTKTMNKLKSGDYFPVRYGNTIRAKSKSPINT